MTGNNIYYSKGLSGHDVLISDTWDNDGKINHATIVSGIDPITGELLYAGNTHARYNYSTIKLLEASQGGLYIIKIKDSVYGEECE